MKIKIILNNSEQDSILKKYFLKTLPPSIKEEDIEIDYDSSHEPSFSIDDFENKQKLALPDKLLPNFSFYKVGNDTVISNCTDNWNGIKAFGYEPRYAVLIGERYSVYYRDKVNVAICANTNQTFEQAEAYVKSAPHRGNK